MTPARSPFLISLGSALAVALWLWLFVAGVYGGRWSGLFVHGDRLQLPAELIDDGLYRYKGDGYDGQFYRLIAHDPFFQKNYAQYLDAPRLRYRRILLPVAAWALALGQDRWIDTAYVAAVVGFVALGVWWSSQLAIHFGFGPLWGVAFLFFPAVVLSVQRLLVDGPFLALSVGFVLHAVKRDRKRVWVVLAAACLCRETGILLLIAYCLHLLLNREWRWAAISACAVLPFLGWATFVAARAVETRAPFLGVVPFAGLFRRIVTPRLSNDPRLILWMIQSADFLSLLGVVLAVALAIWIVIQRPADPIALAALAYSALVAALSDPTSVATVWTDLYAYGRTLGPLFLFVLIEGVRRRDWRFALPTLLLYPRLGLEFASPLLTMFRTFAS